MGVISDAERTGRKAKNDPVNATKMLIYVGIGVSLLGGVIIGIWRMLGGRVASGFGNVARGIWKLGSDTVESGVDATLGATGAD